jgi:serine/threonine-protein kinase
MESRNPSPKALIVDDDDAVVKAQARTLIGKGYQVQTAADGAAALLAVEKDSFDVVLSDLEMPGLTGLELLRRLRDRLPGLPVILVTGHASLETAVQAIEWGAFRYLIKPVANDTLVAAADDAVLVRRTSKASRERGLILGGNVAGRYQLRRDLGRGAAGLVFEAVHSFTGRVVALKVVAPDVPRPQVAEVRARLVREARTLAALQHPGIVDVLDGGVLDDQTPFFVMERLEGRTLEGLLATRGKLSEGETVAIALQLCSVLDAVHRAKVVHRDLKPGNILVVRDRDGQERVKLVDFGLARSWQPQQENLTSIGALVGTVAYMAPEQLCASDDLDGRVDLYALGATMFECLAGEVPYRGPYPRVLLQVSTDRPPPPLPPEVDAHLAAVVARALAKKREDRYATGAELAAAIREAVADAPTRTTLLDPPRAPRIADASPVQRRQFPRAPYTTPVRLLLPDGTIDGRAEDVSEGGMLVICRQPCERNVAVSARFALPIEGRVVSCEAQVRWQKAAHPDVPDGPRALGIEFVNPAASVRASIRRYVELMGEGAAYYVEDVP